MISFLAKRYWGRPLLIPVVIGCGAFSFAQWLKRRLFSPSTMNPQDKARLGNLFGWLSPAMLPEYLRLTDPTHPDYESAFHSLKNIGSEHTKLDGQRAYKMYSFLLCLALLWGAVGWIL